MVQLQGRNWPAGCISHTRAVILPAKAKVDGQVGLYTNFVVHPPAHIVPMKQAAVVAKDCLPRLGNPRMKSAMPLPVAARIVRIGRKAPETIQSHGKAGSVVFVELPPVVFGTDFESVLADHLGQLHDILELVR